MMTSPTCRSAAAIVLTAAIALFAVVVPAQATVISLNGSGTMSTPSYQFLNPTGAANVETNTGVTYAVTVPGQYVYTDTFTSPQLNPLLGTDGAGSYGFQDSEQFSLNTGAVGNILEASISFGSSSLTNLQVRLYGWTTGSPAATVGGVPSGAVSYASWTGIPSGQTSATINFGPVPSGTYILDVRGTANGSGGGFYVGQIIVEPVPLPAALPLLLSGLGMTAGFMRRRRQS